MIKPILKFGSSSKDATGFAIIDTTGGYDAALNPGGYGPPNAVIPTKFGLVSRYWSDDLPLSNVVITTLDTLFTTGQLITRAVLGLTDNVFPAGVYQLKYYPLETSTMVVSLTQDSAKITVTAGTLPSALDPAYIAVVITDSLGAVKSKVLYIDRTQPLTAVDFYVDQLWGNANVAGYKLMLATEADLKILLVDGAVECLVDRIGSLSSFIYCDRSMVDRLTDLTLWRFAADIKFQCQDYYAAHSLITAVQAECTKCNIEPCQTCS